MRIVHFGFSFPMPSPKEEARNFTVWKTPPRSCALHLKDSSLIGWPHAILKWYDPENGQSGECDIAEGSKGPPWIERRQ